MNNTLEMVKSRIDGLLARKQPVIVAIDGNCTAGKTTLAGELAQVYDCNVIHMDDFFLRPQQRTPQRFAQIGGNVDYERFFAEVLTPLKRGLPFSYQAFDCSTGTLGRPILVAPKPLTIIEGTYSHHPYFLDTYDLKILLTISTELQKKRVLERPVFLHKRFLEEWIPMEDRYFSQLGIGEKADLVLVSEQ